MKNHHFVQILFLLGVVGFDLLFWDENFGLNVLLFAIFSIAALFMLHPQSRFSGPAILTAAGTLLMAIMVVWHNSILSKLLFWFSFVAMIGFAQHGAIRTIYSSLLIILKNFWTVPRNLVKLLGGGVNFQKQALRWYNRFKLMVLPAGVVMVFFFIYYNANPKFAALCDSYQSWIIPYLVENLDPERIIFWIFTVLIVSSYIWKNSLPGLVVYALGLPDSLTRRRKQGPTPITNILGLKKEYKMSLMLIIALNLLLLIVNMIDIQYVWFEFEGQTAQSLKNYVHEGTYLLIMAILLAIGVLLFVFRRNLHFYPDRGILKLLSSIWILQNAFLAYSVFMRNWRYIEYYGLAYKRIGVVIFLCLVMIGLTTILIKIKRNKTTFYLLNCNAWGIYLVLLMAATVNWDVFITRYNIFAETKDRIDVDFLINEVSDKNLYLLYKHRENLLSRGNAQSDAGLLTQIDAKRKRFEKREKEQSWVSWNFSDTRNRRFLAKMGL